MAAASVRGRPPDPEGGRPEAPRPFPAPTGKAGTCLKPGGAVKSLGVQAPSHAGLPRGPVPHFTWLLDRE